MVFRSISVKKFAQDSLTNYGAAVKIETLTRPWSLLLHRVNVAIIDSRLYVMNVILAWKQKNLTFKPGRLLSLRCTDPILTTGVVKLYACTSKRLEMLKAVFATCYLGC